MTSKHKQQQGLAASLLEEMNDDGRILYALVDTAHSREVFERISRLNEARRICLLGGGLARLLRQHAPYLVKLTPKTAPTRWLLQHGWEKGWALYLASRVSAPELAAFFRGFLLVETPESAAGCHFRFYDPRVWRDYLQGCEPEERRLAFQLVDHYLLPDADGMPRIHTP